MQARQIILLGSAGLAGMAALLVLRSHAAHPKGPDPAIAPPPASAAPAPSTPPPSTLGVPLMPPRFEEEIDVSTFQKGNIHTHTTWSDGDRPPQDVYLWFRERGYNFLAITDHNTITDPAVF